MLETMAPKSEQKWEEESWARTLMEAEEIKRDSTKFKRAVKAAKRMAAEKKKEATIFGNIGKKAERM